MACQLHDREERRLSQLGGKVACPSRKKSEALREARQVAGGCHEQAHTYGAGRPPAAQTARLVPRKDVH